MSSRHGLRPCGMTKWGKPFGRPPGRIIAYVIAPGPQPSLLVILRRLFLVAAALALPAAAIAQQTDVIRGRIIGPDSVPVVQATITVTSISGNVNRSTRTDKDG